MEGKCAGSRHVWDQDEKLESGEAMAPASESGKTSEVVMIIGERTAGLR
jgi:hypothetical protein